MNPFAISSICSVDALLAALAQGQALKYLYFWGHTAPPHAPLGKECFSQWYPAAFTHEGTTYPTTEHYMMAEKARLFGDEATRAAILKARHPDEAKRLGRQMPASTKPPGRLPASLLSCAATCSNSASTRPWPTFSNNPAAACW